MLGACFDSGLAEEYDANRKLSVLVRRIVAVSMLRGVNSALWLIQDYSEKWRVMRVGGSGCGGV